MPPKGLNKLKNYPQMGTPQYNHAVDQAFADAGASPSVTDRSSPRYVGVDRDVTLRGLDPFSPEVYRLNQALRNRVGFAELPDDQANAIYSDEHARAVAQANQQNFPQAPPPPAYNQSPGRFPTASPDPDAGKLFFSHPQGLQKLK